MKEIIISRGYIALVDDEDFERANQFKWQSNVKTGSKTVYVQRGDYSCGKPKTQFLHHFIMGITDAKKNGITVDHINHNALDNRKSNLRICTYKENWRNRSKNKNGTSKFKGVSWSKTKSKYRDWD